MAQRCVTCNAVIADGVDTPYDARRSRCDACARGDQPARATARRTAHDAEDEPQAPARRAPAHDDEDDEDAKAPARRRAAH